MAQTTKLTILAEPVLNNIQNAKRIIKNLLKIAINLVAKKPLLHDRISYYGGHYGVTRSLVVGLKKAGINFLYNPHQGKWTSNVVVLSGIKTLGEAIAAKRSGRISYLAAGPNISVSPQDDGKILASPEIDACLVPSYWVKDFYIRECPALKDKIIIWAAGIDENYWKPKQNTVKKLQILLYWKTESAEFIEEVKRTIIDSGYTVKVIRYGHYDPKYYRRSLAESCLAIFVSRSESQGLALAETWSMDVPTFCFDPKELTYANRVYPVVSACPYLSDGTGKAWKTSEDLKGLIDDFKNNKFSFQPRAWVLENMTDTTAAQALINKLP